MKIYANQTFLDNRDRYKEGQTYDVPENKAHQFIILGWASYAGKTPLWRRWKLNG